jgi:cyanate permease
VAHLIARLTPDIGARGAAAALSLITLCAILGRALLGWFLRDHNRRIIAALNFFAQSVGVLLLAMGGATALPLVGCVLFGLTGGNHLTLPPLIAQQEFAPADVATAVALCVAISQGALAFGPAAFGLLYDATGDYVLPFALAAIADVLAAVGLLAGRTKARRFILQLVLAVPNGQHQPMVGPWSAHGRPMVGPWSARGWPVVGPWLAR